MSDINKENIQEKEKSIPVLEVIKNTEEINIKEVEKTIKKDNKKAFKGFVGIIIVGGIFGGVIGFLISTITQSGTLSPVKAIKSTLFTFTPYMLPLIFIVCGFLTLFYYRQAKVTYGSWDGEDEYTMNDAEMSISRAMLSTTIGSITGLFFLGVQIFYVMEVARSNHLSWMDTVIMLAFILLIFFFVFCQKKLVDFTRILNPEKNGSAYDLKFQDIWLESCDEAERMNIYKSAYSSYKFMNIFLIILWAVTMFMAIGFGTGLLAMTMVSISWLALNLSYSLKAMKLEKLKESK